LQLGPDFIGLNGHQIAVPFRSLKLDDPQGSIVLPGASRAALQKLPVFLYNHLQSLKSKYFTIADVRSSCRPTAIAPMKRFSPQGDSMPDRAAAGSLR
jgi:hypothetical protein